VVGCGAPGRALARVSERRVMHAAYEAMHAISLVVGIAACAILVYGLLRGLASFARSELGDLRGDDVADARRSLRHSLGYYLLLALQFLIAADIIETMVEPDLQKLAILGGIIAIRTAIAFSLTWELKH